MKNKLASLSVVFITISSLNVWAQSIAAISPTVDESLQYQSVSTTINQSSAQCLNDTWNTHIAFFNKYKVSKYYGDRHPDWGDRNKRLKIIRQVGAPEYIVDEQEPISCIGLTLKCLEYGFKSTQNNVVINLWKRIKSHVVANGTQGDVLIKDLQPLGWKVMYWNPDPSQNQNWDQEDIKILKWNKKANWNTGVKNFWGRYVFNPGWGFHEARYNSVMSRNLYEGMKVDDKQTLVGFGTQVPESFKAAPFFVAIAHAGYHVFSGAFGEVIEGHSMRPLNSINNLERAPYNPLAGEAPKWTNSEKYRSGVIAVPPGY